MNKGLEALNVLYEYLLDEYDIRGMEDIDKNKNIIEKELKALEIIKKKGVNLYKLKICDSVEEYNKLCNSDLPLTKKEYNLLREVLL